MNIRFISYAALAVLAFSAVSCAKNPSADTYESSKKVLEAWLRINYPDLLPSGRGIYVIDSVEASGISMSLDSMGITADQRNSVYIQFNSDGTGTLCAMGEEEAFNWEGNTMTSPDSPDEPLTFTYADNKVTVEQDGIKMTFAHE